MIHGFLCFNSAGKIRLKRFYLEHCPQKKQELTTAIATGVLAQQGLDGNIVLLPEEGLKAVYQRCGTYYFVFIVDDDENELAIVDLCCVFERLLDSVLPKLTEAVLMTHFDVVNYVLDEMVVAAQLFETDQASILDVVHQMVQDKIMDHSV